MDGTYYPNDRGPEVELVNFNTQILLLTEEHAVELLEGAGLQWADEINGVVYYNETGEMDYNDDGAYTAQYRRLSEKED